MPTIAEGMVQLNVPIPENLRDLLDQEIIKRCGYPKRGILGEVITEALREYLYKRHAHTHIQNTNANNNIQTQKKVEGLVNSSKSNNRYEDKYRFLCETIKKYGNKNNYNITPLQISDFIKQIIGKDERTIKKYIELLECDFIICPETNGNYSTPKPPKPLIKKTTRARTIK